MPTLAPSCSPWCHENAELVELGVQSVFIAPVHLRTAGEVLAWTPALA